jgi:hypothetical protein
VTRGLREAFGVTQVEDISRSPGVHTSSLVFRTIVRGSSHLLKIIMRAEDPTHHHTSMKAYCSRLAELPNKRKAIVMRLDSRPRIDSYSSRNRAGHNRDSNRKMSGHWPLLHLKKDSCSKSPTCP